MGRIFLIVKVGGNKLNSTKNDSDLISNQSRIDYVRAKKRKNDYLLTMLTVIGVLGFFMVWQAVVQIGLVSSRYLASPVEIFRLFIVKLYNPQPDGAVLGINVLSSLEVALGGFLLAIIIGVPLGLLMGWFQGFDKFMRPIFEIVRPIPPVAWIPLTIVWLGIGMKAESFIVFFSAFIPCVINAYTGIRQTNPVLINFAKTCGASNFIIFIKMGIPSAMTMTFAGINVALGNAWATLVAAEMLAASAGLGYMILMGRQFARPDLIILGIVVIAFIGAFLTVVLGKIQDKVLGWKKR